MIILIKKVRLKKFIFFKLNSDIIGNISKIIIFINLINKTIVIIKFLYLKFFKYIKNIKKAN